MILYDAPPPLGVLFGARLGWDPTREGQPCDHRCQTCGGRIAVGSRLYCAACTRTGFESRLRGARVLARRHHPKPAPKFRPKLTRADIRSLARTPEGREWLTSRGWL